MFLNNFIFCALRRKKLYLALYGGIGYLCAPVQRWSGVHKAKAVPPSQEGRKALMLGYYGLLAIGNGHAPGTEIGLGSAGTGGDAVTG